jgi:hypothetical protein
MADKNNLNKAPEEEFLEDHEKQAARAESRMLELLAEVTDMRRAIRWFNDQMTSTIAPLILKIRILEVEVAAARGDKAELAEKL